MGIYLKDKEWSKFLGGLFDYTNVVNYVVEPSKENLMYSLGVVSGQTLLMKHLLDGDFDKDE